MDFTFSAEQRLLGDMVSRFAAREYTFEKRRAIKNSAEGWSRDVWRSLADLGLLAINIPEEGNDPENAAANTMVVMNALGSCLLLEPYLQSAVVATGLLRELANEIQQRRYFPAMADGNLIAALAVLEPDARYDLAHVETRAAATDDGFVLNGRKSVVAHAPSADLLLVSARVAGEVGDTDGISLFAVPARADGVHLNAYRMLDGQPGADVTLHDVCLPSDAQIGPSGWAFDAIERAHHIGIAALAAEAVGIMDTLVGITADHLQTRQQFGQPLGRFQALQHRMAEMLVHCEQARSMSYLASAHCSWDDIHEQRKTISATKVLVGRATRFVRQQALQLHGGMGMTDEINVSHYFKRLMAMEASFGGVDSHLEAFIIASRAADSARSPSL